MRKSVISVVAISAAMSLGLAACGDDKKKDPPAAAPAASTPAPAATPAASTPAPAATPAASTPAPPAGKVKVGVILPDSKSSARWETADRKFLKEAFDAAGVEAIIQNAEGDKQAFQTIGDQLLTSGAKVLLMANLDSGSGKAVQDKAKAQGVPTIDYDRLTLGGSADYYVSFDNESVGKLQGEGLLKCLEEKGKKEGNIVYLNGSPTDNNATLFKNGYDGVLSAATQFKKIDDQAVPDWDNAKGGVIFEQMYTKSGGKIDGVAAANDGLGNAAIGILKKNKVNGQIPVTGQDATVEGLQNILAGDQCMTVYKAIKAQAQAAAALAVALAKGEPASQADKVVKDGDRDVKSVLLVPVAITKENIKAVLDDGFQKREDVCKGDFEAKCVEAGL